MKNIAIIGSGSWGVALAIHLAKLGNNIKMWSFNEEERDLINNEKKCKFLPKVTLPDNIYCTTSFEETLKDTELVLHVTPSKVTRSIAEQYAPYITTQPVIMCSKGFEKDTLSTLADVIKEVIPNVKFGALSGPSHAEEVSLGIPTAIVIASKHEEILDSVQNLFMCETLRVYTSTDVKGVELGGALKNIIAFCAGIIAGIELGDNSFAALITRGLKEISSLGVELGGNSQTFYGLTGLGDLIVTCLSEHSRNRKAGKLIGQGKSIDEVKEEVGMTIEAIDNIEVAYDLAKIHNVETPIINAVYDVLYNGLDPKVGVKMLMTRGKKTE